MRGIWQPRLFVSDFSLPASLARSLWLAASAHKGTQRHGRLHTDALSHPDVQAWGSDLWAGALEQVIEVSWRWPSSEAWLTALASGHLTLETTIPSMENEGFHTESTRSVAMQSRP